MEGLLIIAVTWFGSGALGAYLAYRGSVRDYGENIYSRRSLAALPFMGYAGLAGSAIAW